MSWIESYFGFVAEKYMNSSFADEILFLFVEGEDKLMIDDEHIVLWMGIVGV